MAVTEKENFLSPAIRVGSCALGVGNIPKTEQAASLLCLEFQLGFVRMVYNNRYYSWMWF